MSMLLHIAIVSLTAGSSRYASKASMPYLLSWLFAAM